MTSLDGADYERLHKLRRKYLVCWQKWGWGGLWPLWGKPSNLLLSTQDHPRWLCAGSQWNLAGASHLSPQTLSIWLMYSFKLQVYNSIFKAYTPFIVIKYWLYSLCCTIYPVSYFILNNLKILILNHHAPEGVQGSEGGGGGLPWWSSGWDSEFTK